MKLSIIAAAAIYCFSQGAVATVNPAQLQAWQAFFDETGGSNWSRCKGKRDSPCTCEGTGDAEVVCIEQDGQQVIESIKLNNIGLTGATFPAATVNLLVGANAAFQSIDLRNNPNLKNPSGACLPIPNCASRRCRFDADVCAVSGDTPAPSASNTTTVAPSASTNTTAPTTKAPTAQETNSPTTGAPVTAAPTRQGDTFSPTVPVTKAPSSPPTPVTTATQPPSTSASSTPIGGVLASVALTAMVAMMM